MQFFRFRTTIACVIALLPIFVFGCGQPEVQQQASTAKGVPNLEQATDAADNKTDAPKAQPIPAVNELILIAAKSLSNNEVEMAKNALVKAREKSNDYLGAKFDIARLLFGAGEMKASAEVYDEILELRPDIKPELWQRGLALYYAEEYEKGLEQFDTHQSHNSQDVENSVWHLMCKSRLTSVEEARKSMIIIEHDKRVPMKQVFDMFAGTGSPEEVIAASGYDPDNVVRRGTTYHGWLYVSLFHEMMGDQEASNEAMKTALKCKPVIRSLMGYVAEGHLRIRGAYPTGDK